MPATITIDNPNLLLSISSVLDDLSNPVFWCVAAFPMAIGIALYIREYRCPKCKKIGAFRKTGMIKEAEGQVRGAQVEWKCVHCDFSEWRQRRSSSGGHGGGSWSEDQIEQANAAKISILHAITL